MPSDKERLDAIARWAIRQKGLPINYGWNDGVMGFVADVRGKWVSCDSLRSAIDTATARSSRKVRRRA